MTSPAHARRFSPRLHQLESRDVPAGNVTITQLGTELRVIGDTEANSFTIWGRGPGVVEIQGHGTTVNGANAKVTMSGVEWLRVAGRANDDVIKTRDLEIAQVDVFGQGGNDVLDTAGSTGDVFYAFGGSEDDTIRTRDLAYGQLNVYGEAGNDVLDIAGTTEGFFPLDLFTDTGLQLVADGGGGDDTIRVTDTNVRGDFCGLFVNGGGGSNSITISNTRVARAGEYGGILNLSVNNGYSGVAGVSSDITIDGLSVDMAGPDTVGYLGWISWAVDINYYSESDADDTIRLRNWDLSGRGNDTDVYGDMYVFGGVGSDQIQVENVSTSLLTPAGIGRSNQNFSYFDADQVTMRNLRQEGGVFDGSGSSGSILGISAVEADLRNVAVTSATGYGNLFLSSPFDFETGNYDARDASFTLANVTVSGGEIGGFTDIYTGDGNDSIRATNSELGRFSANLGEGNDRLTFVNVAFSAPYYEEYGYGGIDTGGGDDAVTLTNCNGESIHIDTGDGDDAVTLKNCVFVTADLFGGDGTDELNLFNISGLFNIDGFEW